jgi:protocatechuate 3,4-dioxygenase beta subunit
MTGARRLALVAVITVALALVACDSTADGHIGKAEPATAASTGPRAEEPVATATAIAKISQPTCTATPRQTEGPFYFDIGEVRKDITEGKAGMPLMVVLHLVEAGSCAPIGDAKVDIWHTDALGQYSGYPGQGDDRADTSGETFLRGRQITDADGRVEFETIYPGWYPGRTVHIHFKAFTDGGNLIASQMYFPDDISDAVFETEPYSARGPRRTTNANDSVGRDETAQQALMGRITRNDNGYMATLTIGVTR